MSASVRYWRMPEEEADFVRYVESLEPTLVFPYAVFPNAGDVRWLPAAEGFASKQVRLFITPARFIDRVHTTWADGVTAQGHSLDIANSPVLGYVRGVLEHNRLSTTVASAGWTYLSDDGKTILDHPADFVRWGKQVMQWVRKAAPLWYEHKAHRITPKAEAARQAGLQLE